MTIEKIKDFLYKLKAAIEDNNTYKDENINIQTSPLAALMQAQLVGQMGVVERILKEIEEHN